MTTIKKLAFATAVGLLLAAAVPVYAHHSFTKVFDARQPVTVRGVFTRMEWANPHVWFHVEVKDEQGKIQKWRFEAQGTPTISRSGWKRNSFLGDEVIVEGSKARELIINGFYTGSVRSVVLVNGNKEVYNNRGQ